MNKTLKSATKFIVVGAVSTAINYFCFFVLTKFAITGYILASITGYIIGLIAGYFLNNFWTFQHPGYNVKIIAGYLMVYLFSLGLSSLFLWVTVDYFKLNKYIMNVGAIGVSTVTNFLCLNLIVYKNNNESE